MTTSITKLIDIDMFWSLDQQVLHEQVPVESYWIPDTQAWQLLVYQAIPAGPDFGYGMIHVHTRIYWWRTYNYVASSHIDS